MKFRTEIAIPESVDKFDYATRFYSIGSCFAENLGQELQTHKFRIANNPMGTVFNPMTIFDQIRHLTRPSLLSEQDIVEVNGVYYHNQYYHHLHESSKTDLFETIHRQVQFNKTAFSQANVLIITLGTAFVHELKSTGQIVGNCHKQPATLFHKRKLRLEEILNNFHEIAPQLNHFNKIILTVSPVRHTREGLSENQWSKSLLRVVCETLADQYEQIVYFPSYEIMMDDLRDYRWYEADMIHPNPQAKAYIYDLFYQTYLSPSCNEIRLQVQKINQVLQHRVTQTGSIEHKKLLESTIRQIEALKTPHLFDTEHKQVKEQLNTFF